MSATDSLFAGSIPEVYERLLVPMLFEPYARDLAERVARVEPLEVLETAAGTGALTRALASTLSARARIVVTDLNQPMLSFGAGATAASERITRRQADALALPFADGTFDVVVCQFGVMFFPDKLQGYREARRVLKRGGHFLFNVWDRIEENEFAAVVQDALAPLFPADPPRFMERTPHGYHDLEQIRAQLKQAGFTGLTLQTRSQISRSPSAQEAAHAFCQGTPLRNQIETRDPARLAEATQAAARALTQRFGEGPLEGGMRAHVIGAVC
jgi:ubiquinone/menaquinone biosynthesis C-methylase UbiE